MSLDTGLRTSHAGVARKHTLLGAALCAIALAGCLLVASPARAVSICGTRLTWIEASPSDSGKGFALGCSEASSTEAQARFSITSTRAYAQLITVSGTILDSERPSAADRSDARMSTLLQHLSPRKREQLLLLGAYHRATLTIDRPAPGESTQEIHLAPAQGARSALAGRVVTFLSVARRARVTVPAAVENCLAASLMRAISSAGAAAAGPMRLCVERSSSTDARARSRLHRLAGRILSERLLKRPSALQPAEAHPPDIDLTIPSVPPGPYNPSLHLELPSIGTVADGRRTIKHLGASGGLAPYRYYILAEPGGPRVPPWVHLMPDGTLTIEPPVGVDTQVNLSIQVIDSNGERSEVFP